MFKSIRVRDFRSYKDSRDVPLAPLTFIVGANNSGKSTLIKALLLLKQTVKDGSPESALVTVGPYVNMGSFFDIVRNGREGSNRQFGIEVEFVPEEGQKRSQRMRHHRLWDRKTRLELTYGFDERRSRIVVKEASISEGRRSLISAKRTTRGFSSPQIPPKMKRKMRVRLTHFLPVVSPLGPIGSHAEDEKLYTLMLMTSQLRNTWEEALNSVTHVAPLRRQIPFYADLGSMASAELGSGGENLLRVLSSDERRRHSKRSLLSDVDSWVSDRFGMLQSLRLDSLDEAGLIRSLKGFDAHGKSEVNLAGMGEGVSQVLPIVVRSLIANEDNTILIEQPEIHLHPAAQANLADLFVDVVKKIRGSQFIVETHSEHLLLRIRRHIALGLPPELVSILIVERKKGLSQVRRLNLTKSGNFEKWPEGFFEEGYREALALAEGAPIEKR